MMPDVGDVPRIFSRHLDSRGDGSGVITATGLYADNTVTFTNATNVVNLSSHGFVAGDGPFQFSNSGGALPSEISESTDYWLVETVAAGTFQISTSQGGSVLTFSDDGTGTHTMENPFRFYIEAQAGQILRIARLLVHIEDGFGWSAANYGNLGSALTTGITLHTEDANGSQVLNLTNDDPVKSNADWGKFCYDVAYVNFGAGNDFLQARWTFAKSGVPVRLIEGERLVITVNDDMAGLAAHNFVVQGYNELS